MNFKLKILPSFLLLLVSLSDLNSQGFLRVQGDKIVNDVNQNFIIKGMGLGGWLVQEGYMLKTGILDAEHQIKKGITELVGLEKTEELYTVYRKNYVRRIDIDSLKKWGFNSIRLPMHYNKLLDDPFFEINEEGFKTIDTLLVWCKENEMYLILDLHAAPGGQSAGGIADYDPSKPSLWESELNKQVTVDLWRTLAERYADEEWIGGYDLINEPAWELGADAAPLRDLYIRITDAIREVDDRHIIFIEGNWWATDFSGLTPPWDDNLVYSFHKYWNETDQGTINYLLSIRNTYNRPLWLGETGENSNDWFRECVELMEENNIGWTWWPHKKIDNISSPLSSPVVEGYKRIIDYWNGSGSKPDEDFAYSVLKNQFEALAFENCKIQPDVYNSILKPKAEKSYPFKDHTVPGIIYGVDYDRGGYLVGYSDADYKNVGGGSYNSGWSYRNDGVDIEECSDSQTNGYNVGWTNTGEWLRFTVFISDSGYYDFNFRFAAVSNDGKFMLDLDSYNLIPFTDIPNSGGYQNWQTLTVKNVKLPQGKHSFNLRFFFGGFNFNFMEITPSVTGIKNENTPNEYKLLQNYPNPFNPDTKITYSLPEKSYVELTVYNSLGKRIISLEKSVMEAGTYDNIFSGSRLSSGIYFCELKAESVLKQSQYNSVIKAILLK